MSAFILTDGDEAIGWSVWPWDGLYRPVIGAFASGRLVATASCRLEKPRDSRKVSLRLHARVGRRLMRTVLGAEAVYGAVPVPLDGPAASVWFRMALPPDLADRLRRGDSTVRLERLEDGETLSFSSVPSASTERPASAAAPGVRILSGPLPVEALLDAPDGPSPDPLDGFAAFLTLPPLHQLQGVFHEYLRRLPEPEARGAFLPQFKSGVLSILDLRDIVLASDEFRARRVGYGARLGAALTSQAWTRLVTLPPMRPPEVPSAADRPESA